MPHEGGSARHVPRGTGACRRQHPLATRLAALLAALFVVLLAADDASAQARAAATPLRVREARIEVTVAGAERATVRERLVLEGRADSLALEHLGLPCSALGPIALLGDGAPLALARSEAAPWVRLVARGATTYELAYDVALRGRDPRVPIVLPAAPLATDGPRGAAALQLTARLPAGARPLLPRLEPLAGDTLWGTGLVAAPSFVRVRLAGAAPDCGERVAGDSGRFLPLVAAFVGTLALWVPLYLAWAARRADGAA